jgi:Restriction endonuclease NotI
VPNHPLAEVFGFPTDNHSPDAQRYRQLRLCPFNNRVPHCTKDKANDPLGVCSVNGRNDVTITCPVRFRQDWLILEHAKRFFFPPGTACTSLVEVRLNDKNGRSAGNIDVVLVSYDEHGTVTDFGALEVQAVYISGSIRPAFAHYMEDPQGRADMDWSRRKDRPRPDYLSSSRKRLAPQLIFKGGILKAWNRKLHYRTDF